MKTTSSDTVVANLVCTSARARRRAGGEGNDMVVHDTEMLGIAASRVMFEHCSDGLLFCGHDGRISAANPAACTMLEMAASDLCGSSFDELLDPDDPRWGIVLAERSRSGWATGVVRLRRGDGRSVELETTSRVFRAEDGSTQVFTVLHDVASRIAIERELEELSTRLLQLSRGDELTGLANRRGLIAAGTRMLQLADRHDADVTTAFVDVGNVQELNDLFGHQAGDAALQAVARALSVTFRPHDVVARVGGTEFLVLALKLAEVDCAAISGQLHDHLAAPETTSFVGAPVEVALGWTVRRRGERSSLEELIDRSDWAMSEARAARGRGGPSGAPPCSALRDAETLSS
jgi:diguanylate cyclase (GGDEF)-like protein/PAS domain S-box-containing protein